VQNLLAAPVGFLFKKQVPWEGTAMEDQRDSSALELCTGKHPVLEEEKEKEKLKSE